VTRGAQKVTEADEISIEQTTLNGLARVIRMEYPLVRCISLDLDPQDNDPERTIATELNAAMNEDEVAWRGGTRFAARLQRHRPRRSDKPLTGAWLIAGGLGALGLQLASWLVKQGVRELVLAGRNNPRTEALAAIAELERSGATIRTESVDIANAEAVDTLVAGIENLRGVIHAAGVLEDGLLMRQTPKQFARVLAPKVTGAWNLHAATLARPLDHFVLFSSTAAVLGSPGQGNYAAANSFLDGLAHYRHTLGLPGLSIDWGPWSGTGMADEIDDAHRRRRRSNGISDIEPKHGLAVFGELLQDDSAQVMVLPVDWELMLRQFPAGKEPTILAHLGNRDKQIRSAQGHLLLAVQSATPQQRRTVLTSLLRQEISRVLALEPSVTIGLAQPLSELGLDSLMAVELRNAIAAGFDLTLASTTLFDYPRLDALAEHIKSELFSTEPETVAETSRSTVSDDFGDLLATLETLDESDVSDMLAGRSRG
jgi:acyl carrier protein